MKPSREALGSAVESVLAEWPEAIVRRQEQGVLIQGHDPHLGMDSHEVRCVPNRTLVGEGEVKCRTDYDRSDEKCAKCGCQKESICDGRYVWCPVCDNLSGQTTCTPDDERREGE